MRNFDLHDKRRLLSDAQEYGITISMLDTNKHQGLYDFDISQALHNAKKFSEINQDYDYEPLKDLDNFHLERVAKVLDDNMRRTSYTLDKMPDFTINLQEHLTADGLNIQDVYQVLNKWLEELKQLAEN